MDKDLTIVLTSRENFVWLSMQEIIPHIEQCWSRLSNQNTHVRIINIDQVKLKEIALNVLMAKNIVVTCFNYKMARTIVFIRNELSLSTRLIFHLHNLSTIALWPLYEFKVLQTLRASDLFISSCTRDWNTLRLSVHDPKGDTIPFSIPEHELGSLATAPHLNVLYFVGRISRQKNIHLVLFALHMLKQENKHIEFHVFGEEDGLGSPNMGIKDFSYLNELCQIVKELDLTEQVHFHGKLDREKIYGRWIKKGHIFISVSAHSDENFGMAAFRAICRGDRLVLSDWGGHADFKDNFSNQIEFVNINNRNINGLSSSPESIKEALEKILTVQAPEKINLQAYGENSLSVRYSNLLNRPQEDLGPIKMTPFFYDIINRRRVFKTHPTKIFTDYGDELARPIFEEYGLCDFHGKITTI